MRLPWCSHTLWLKWWSLLKPQGKWRPPPCPLLRKLKTIQSRGQTTWQFCICTLFAIVSSRDPLRFGKKTVHGVRQILPKHHQVRRWNLKWRDQRWKLMRWEIWQKTGWENEGMKPTTRWFKQPWPFWSPNYLEVTIPTTFEWVERVTCSLTHHPFQKRAQTQNCQVHGCYGDSFPDSLLFGPEKKSIFSNSSWFANLIATLHLADWEFPQKLVGVLKGNPGPSKIWLIQVFRICSHLAMLVICCIQEIILPN